MNRSAQRLFGRLEGGKHGLRIDDLVSLGGLGQRQLTRTKGSLSPRLAQGRRADGTTFAAEISVAPFSGNGSRHRVLFLRDVALREAEHEALRHQATHDPLTDLPNRNLLLQRARDMLERARESERRIAVLLIDLVRFDDINDALGHHTGDQLLQQLADRLRGVGLAEETVARYGGDEFAVLLPEEDLAAVRRRAWHFIRAVQKPFHVDGLSLEVEPAAGIALFPDHGRNVDELLQRADMAMYAARRSKAGAVVYRPDHDFTCLRHHALTGDLRRAIEQGDLALHYQPKLNARSGHLVGVEALARWQHPEFGFIRPDEFITLAEQTGLIFPLTRWVLEAATIQCAQWLREGFEFGVSVNVSARILLEREFPRLLERLLVATAVPPRYLTLEITESAVMEDPDKALEALIELYALGVGLSIDDFGTGYSSLGYLKKLPASELKIDKSFVLEMDRNRDDATIVKSIIDLAHNLGVNVVAEGVETDEVWEQLRELGCDVGQGYLFSRPIPPEQLIQWVEGMAGDDEGLTDLQETTEQDAATQRQ
jgi:diguanylate cyclase (GGDEF)-like protein